MPPHNVAPENKVVGSLFDRVRNPSWRDISMAVGAVVVAFAGYKFYSSLFPKSGDGSSGRRGSSSARPADSGSKEIQPLIEEVNPPTDASSPITEGNVTLHYILSLTPGIISGLSEEEKAEYSKRLKEEGNSEFRQKKYAEAVRYYTSGLDFHFNPVLYCNRAACHINLQNYEEAISDCDKALASNSTYIKAYLRRGQACEQLLRYRDALNDYTAAHIFSNSLNEVSSTSIERVLKLIASAEAKELFKTREPAFPCFTFVENFMNPFNFEKLPESAEDDNAGDKAYRLANNLMTEKKYEEAYKQVEEAVKETTKFQTEALILRAMFYVLMRRPEDALADAEKASSISPEAHLPLVIKATMVLEKGDLDAALNLLEQAKKVAPNSYEVYYHYGQFMFMNGDFTAAIREYRRCIELKSNMILAHIQLGVSQFKLNDVLTADQTYRDLIRDYPKSPEAHNYYAELLMALERNDEAMKQYTEALACDPAYIISHVNMAILHIQHTKNLAEAEKCCKRALEYDSNSELANGTLAQIYLSQDKMADAAKAFQRCTDIARTEQEMEASISYREAALATLRFREAHPEVESNHIF